MQINQFKKYFLDNTNWYLSFQANEKEICLEPCFDGFCVAIYDQDGELLADKVCTGHEGYLEFPARERRIETVERALAIATEFFNVYCV